MLVWQSSIVGKVFLKMAPWLVAALNLRRKVYGYQWW
jgi:hypothetical protein